MENCLHVTKTTGQNHTFMSSRTLGIPSPDALARRVCRILMETTSGEEVFAFIAAAAAGTGNDDAQKERVYKKQENQPRRNRGVIPRHITRKQEYPREN